MSSTTPTRTEIPLPGEPAPPFTQRTPANPQFNFDTAAGRYLALCFLGSAADAQSRAAAGAVLARPDLFNDVTAACFLVSNDPTDETENRLANQLPGFRVFWDFNLSVARLYGAAAPDARPPALPATRFWLLLDPTMRIIATVPFREDGSDAAAFIRLLETLPPPARFAGIELQAPVLYLPNVFELELCRHLIGLYETNGGHESGFMRDVGGRTVGISDARHKRRKDYDIHDMNLIAGLRSRIAQRVVPEIAKVHQFKVTRMERYIVSCYAAKDGGHFAAHRDNTTAGTAHRRFAVSINLNDDFDGGEVSFPEYGPRSFKASPGGAVVFSCSLLHKVGKVTRGRRFAFLPFLYDEAAAQLRQRNAALVGEKGSRYRAG
ncbi:2OG-Fe(II) oxygenase [Fuscovulum blasticum]|uniref:2OG-Fe(II) oxygenase n=1 Tax=Fuscovulum blasticum TaxID=1075 RepID=UPI000D3E0F74|nr:2OG-Fe(II) oxygenase [Fuscovulum blasticum]AWD22328.1 peroxiredoxin [Fuscovulum blasticum]